MLTPSEAAHLDALLAAGPPDWDEGMVECPDCGGRGRAECPVCHGVECQDETVEDACAGCDDELSVPCETCKGEGMVEESEPDDYDDERG